MFTGCHFVICILTEHKRSDILILIGRLFHILFPRSLIEFRPYITLKHLGNFDIMHLVKSSLIYMRESFFKAL